jgi:hypothetical protein
MLCIEWSSFAGFILSKLFGLLFRCAFRTDTSGFGTPAVTNGENNSICSSSGSGLMDLMINLAVVFKRRDPMFRTTAE